MHDNHSARDAYARCGPNTPDSRDWIQKAHSLQMCVCGHSPLSNIFSILLHMEMQQFSYLSEQGPRASIELSKRSCNSCLFMAASPTAHLTLKSHCRRAASREMPGPQTLQASL